MADGIPQRPFAGPEPFPLEIANYKASPMPVDHRAKPSDLLSGITPITPSRIPCPRRGIPVHTPAWDLSEPIGRGSPPFHPMPHPSASLLRHRHIVQLRSGTKIAFGRGLRSRILASATRTEAGDVGITGAAIRCRGSLVAIGRYSAVPCIERATQVVLSAWGAGEMTVARAVPFGTFDVEGHPDVQQPCGPRSHDAARLPSPNRRTVRHRSGQPNNHPAV